MSSPARAWSAVVHATASRYCSRKCASASASLNGRPRRLSRYQWGRGYEPTTVVGRMRSLVAMNTATPRARSGQTGWSGQAVAEERQAAAQPRVVLATAVGQPQLHARGCVGGIRQVLGQQRQNGVEVDGSVA